MYITAVKALQYRKCLAKHFACLLYSVAISGILMVFLPPLPPLFFPSWLFLLEIILGSVNVNCNLLHIN